MADSKHVETVSMKQFWYLMDFAAETKVPFCAWGVKAVGKTQGVYQWCERNNYRCEVLHLATQDVVDLIGMMKVVPGDFDSEKIKALFDKSVNGHKLTDEEFQYSKKYFENGMSNSYKTTWSRPEWLKNDGIPTCYFLDEFNRGNQFVLAAMLPFLIEGKMHTHRIGKEDFVVAACNPSTGNYNVNDSFEADDALRDRCGHAILEPTNEEFFEYAKDKIGQTTMRVLKKSEHYIEIKRFSMPFEVEPSRRSIINVLQHVDKKREEWVRSRASIIIGTYLGSNLRDEWLQQYANRLDALDLYTLMNFDDNADIIEKTITTIIKGEPTIKNDIFEGAQDLIVNWLKTKYRDASSDISWIIKFFNLPVIPKDSIVGLLSKLVTLNKPHLLDSILTSGVLNELDTIKEFNKNESLLENL